MMHTYHEGLPGFDPRQIWRDGCSECESRGADPIRHLMTLDNDRMALAIQRSIDWNKDRDVGHIATAERGLLELLWRFYLINERLDLGARLFTQP